MQRQMNLGKSGFELADNRRQRIAGLGVGGGDRELALIAVGKLRS